jgi:hypothetical protein
MGEDEHMPSDERLRELLVGRRVVRARIESASTADHHGPTGYLTLDNGTVLSVWGNDGGCICGAGDYPLTKLGVCDNVITNVEVEASPDGDEHGRPCGTCGEKNCWQPYHDNKGSYRIFVLAEDRRLLASFDGSDGNGFYGTGWWLSVSNLDEPSDG